MPSLTFANLFAGLVFGAIGFVAFVYGKRMNVWKPMFIGIALMIFPYFVEDAIELCIIGVLGTASLFLLRN